MVVIADTSPLNYLVLIGEVEVLPKLYGAVISPNAVFSELRDPRAPAAVARWLASRPPWLSVEEALPLPGLPSDLDRGECEALALASAGLPDALLLVDDEQGRRQAERRGIPTTGTLGVLMAAAGKGMLNLPLRSKNCRRPTSM